MTLNDRISNCIRMIRAMRVLRWTREWPANNSERQNPPRYVREWEREYGPAPESAEKILNEFQIHNP